MGTPQIHRRLKLFFDGGCRPNPGRIEAAVVLRGIPHLYDDLGHGTNSDAEWQALICAVELAQSLGLSKVVLIGDAAEVILEANRALSTGQAKHRHSAKLLDLTRGVAVPRIRWIKREQNLAGIALAARHPR
jgi:ribonuclease HI